MMHPLEPESPTPADPAAPAAHARGAAASGAVAQERLPARDVGRIFLRIGATAFGGLGSSLSLIDREFVEKRRLLSPEDVAEAVAATRLLPGSALVQVVSLLGYKLGGWAGSALAAFACVAPPAALMLLLAVAYDRVAAFAAFAPAARGLTAAVVGLLLATTYRFARASIHTPLALAITLVSFGSVAVVGIPAAAVVVLAGLIGIPFQTQQAARGQKSAQGGSR